MNLLKLHSTILVTSVAATLAVGIASAAIITDHQPVAAPKSDRLVVAAAPAGARPMRGGMGGVTGSATNARP